MFNLNVDRSIFLVRDRVDLVVYAFSSQNLVRLYSVSLILEKQSNVLFEIWFVLQNT